MNSAKNIVTKQKKEMQENINKGDCVYLKNQEALDDYLINAGVESFLLSNDSDFQIKGLELKDLVEKSMLIQRHIEKLTYQINNIDLIEQAAISGMLNVDMLKNNDAATYLAKRMNQISDEFERGWEGESVNINGEFIVNIKMIMYLIVFFIFYVKN